MWRGVILAPGVTSVARGLRGQLIFISAAEHAKVLRRFEAFYNPGLGNIEGSETSVRLRVLMKSRI